MQSLGILFNKSLHVVTDEMRDSDTILDLINVALTQINKIAGSGSDFAEELDSREQRLVNYFLNSVKNAMSLTSKLEVHFSKKQSKVHTDNRLGDKDDFYDVLKPIVGIIAGTTAAVMIPATAFMSVVGGTFVGTMANKGLDILLGAHAPGNDIQSQQDAVQVKLLIPPGAILSCLETIFTDIDKMFSELDEIRKDVLQENLSRPISLEEIPSILAYLHEMLLFQRVLHDLGEAIPKEIIPLRSHLSITKELFFVHGIEVVEYQAGVNETYFEKQISVDQDVKEMFTLKPALTKEGKLLHSGIVVLPKGA